MVLTIFRLYTLLIGETPLPKRVSWEESMVFNSIQINILILKEQIPECSTSGGKTQDLEIWKVCSHTFIAITPNICLCLRPDRTWHKVNDPKVDYSGGLGEGNVGNEPRLEPWLTMFVIDPLSAMWAWWS